MDVAKPNTGRVAYLDAVKLMIIFLGHTPQMMVNGFSVGGLILGAFSFRNEYDGHTIDDSLGQVMRLTGRTLKRLAGQREETF